MIFVTKDEKVRAFSMYLVGVPLQKISAEFGVSKQRISAIFCTLGTGKRNVEKLANNCVYPALADYILENEINIKEFFALLYKASPKEMYCGKTSTWYCVLITNRVKGKWPFTSAEWLRLREVTGIPLEQLMDSGGTVKLAPRIRKTNEDKSE